MAPNAFSLSYCTHSHANTLTRAHTHMHAHTCLYLQTTHRFHSLNRHHTCTPMNLTQTISVLTLSPKLRYHHTCMLHTYILSLMLKHTCLCQLAVPGVTGLEALRPQKGGRGVGTDCFLWSPLHWPHLPAFCMMTSARQIQICG